MTGLGSEVLWGGSHGVQARGMTVWPGAGAGGVFRIPSSDERGSIRTPKTLHRATLFPTTTHAIVLTH